MTQLSADTADVPAQSARHVATAFGQRRVLVGIIQTPVISHFSGVPRRGPVAWTGVFSATCVSHCSLSAGTVRCAQSVVT